MQIRSSLIDNYELTNERLVVTRKEFSLRPRLHGDDMTPDLAAIGSIRPCL